MLGPQMDATQPGVTSFSGATNNTASRITALVVDPKCSAHKCRLWAGASGGGVWLTTNALSGHPTWKQMSPESLDQNSVGTLVLDPTDKSGNTLYLGTGEGNRCSSGCEAGVGIYKSTDGGKHWTKLADACVSNATYTCVNPGKDSFLGRGINAIVVDPSNSRHLFVGSAQAVRGLSHVIGAGGTVSASSRARTQPGRVRVDQRRRDVHRGLERQRPELVRRHRRQPRPARLARRLRHRVRPGRLAA